MQLIRNAFADVLAILVAAVLGLIIDSNVKELGLPRAQHLVLQISLIVGVVMVFRTISGKTQRDRQLDPLSNIFFISVFLGVQIHFLRVLRSYGKEFDFVQ